MGGFSLYFWDGDRDNELPAFPKWHDCFGRPTFQNHLLCWDGRKIRLQKPHFIPHPICTNYILDRGVGEWEEGEILGAHLG